MQPAAKEESGGASSALTPYVPRLLIEWLRDDPSARHRAIEGTLAFVDISGFTTMTERLARKGKVGAEEMSDTLNACFSDLLSLAYDYGAGLVKWGGDAVLLLFEGEDHAPRACKAALRMQREIRRIGRLKTSAGPVTLRMSVGIHTGTFDFFLVGDLHRELLITGGAASETVAMEQVAEAGDVAVSPTTASLLDPVVLGEEKDGAILLRREPDVEGTRAAPVSGVDPEQIQQCLPIPIRQHLLLERGEPEHRMVAVAFIEFGGIQELFQKEGVAAVAEALEECVTIVQHATSRYQVTFFETDINRDGGKIMLVAGAPTTAGDDSERMLRAVRDVIEAQVPLPLRIGVNYGRVFAGDFGPPYRRTYSVKGDAVNLAARVMGKAVRRQVLATEDALAASRARFEAKALDPFHVKGKAQPVRASVVGPLVESRKTQATVAPLVGREREYATLALALDSAREWQGRLAELVGEAGIGKSRLLEELRTRASDVLVVGVACEQYEAATAYFPFRTLLRTVLGLGEATGPVAAARLLRERVEEIAPHVLPWLPLLAVPLELDVPETPETKALDERFRKTRLEEAVRELLGITLATPTLLVFEDVHWMDDASRDLLTALLAGIELRPWLIVVTRRPEAAGFRAPAGERVVTLELEPLSGKAAGALVEAVTEDVPLPPHHVEALAARSGGNPLFLEQLIKAAQEAESIEALPDSVEALLSARIDRLPPRDRTILRYAAVLGMRFDPELLAAALVEEAAPPDEEVWKRLQELLDADDAGELHFRHALVRDAAYEGLPYKRRRDLHARVGATIERRSRNPEDEAERLSLHFFHAQRFDQAWSYSLVAAQRAAAIYANGESALFYRRALEASRRLPSLSASDVVSASEAMGDVLVRLGELDGATVAYRSSRSGVAGSPVEEARLLRKQALIPWRLGKYTQTLRWIRRGLRAVEGVSGEDAARLRARLQAWHGVVRLRQGRPLEGIEWCHRAIEEGEPVGADEALAHAYFALDYAYFSIGRYDEVVHSHRALAIYEATGNLIEQGAILNNLGMFAYYQGRWDEAIDFYRRAEEVWEKAGDRWSASYATVNRGEILSDQGRLDEAEPLFRAALRVARAFHSSDRIADIARYYGRLAARAGRFDEAHALLGEALQGFERDGVLSEILATQAWVAECLMLEGRAEAAYELSVKTLERAESLKGLFLLVSALHRVLGIALMQLGELDAARDALNKSLAEARLKGAGYEIAVTLDAFVRLHGLLGERADVLELERDELFERLKFVAVPAIPLPARATALS